MGENLDEVRGELMSGQVNDGLTLQPTAGEQPRSIYQQRQQTTNHTAGRRKPCLLSSWIFMHKHTCRHVQIH